MSGRIGGGRVYKRGAKEEVSGRREGLQERS